MRKKMAHILLYVSLIIVSNGCGFTQSAQINNQSSEPQPTTDGSANTKSINNVNAGQTPADNKDSFECVRAVPTAIINKKVFPKTIFTLQKNKEFPFNQLGFETVEFKNGDKLTIEHVGCENYTLVFNFKTKRFVGKPDEVRFWYQTATQLVEQTIKGLREPNLIVRGNKALTLYIKRNKNLKFDEEIDFGGEDIREVVSVSRAEKQSEEGEDEITVSFGVGPL
jgi:hypothetical protein